MTEVAIKYNVDFETGARPVNPFKGVRPGLPPPDPNLHMDGTWQCRHEGWEVSLVINGKPEAYMALTGVVILRGVAEIEAALDCIHRPRFKVYDSALCAMSITQKKIDISDIDNGLEPNEEAAILYQRGALGIKEIRIVPVGVVQVRKLLS